MSLQYSGDVNKNIIPASDGFLISDILTAIITPALKVRKEEWMSEIGQRLKDLEDQGTVNMKDLESDPVFIDTVLHATQLALKTSEADKIKIFQNVIVNTAKGEIPDQTISHVFLRLIDDFTIWHIKMLTLFNNPVEWFRKNNKNLPNNFYGSMLRVATDAYPEFAGQDELLDVVLSDLHRAGFHRTSGLRTSMSAEGAFAERLTDLGKQFLQFITVQ